jgi:hypothetical protein
MKTSMPLIQVIQFYEEKATQMCQDEIDNDFHCKNGASSKATMFGGILSHGAKVYTLVLFRMFEEEFNFSFELSCVETNYQGNSFTYSLTKEEGSKRVHVVHFNRDELTISCDCKLFETLGLLCCHALRVFVVNNVNLIPNKYISIRWTKDAKKRLCCFVDSSQVNGKSTHVLRMNKLNHFWFNIILDKASSTNSGTNYIIENLRMLLRGLEKIALGTNSVEDVGKEYTQENLTHDVPPILDPPHVRKKEVTNARIKSKLETKKRKKVKGVSTSKAPQASSTVHGMFKISISIKKYFLVLFIEFHLLLLSFFLRICSNIILLSRNDFTSPTI